MRFDLADGFPTVTTKKLFLKAIVYELLWFLKATPMYRYLLRAHPSIKAEIAV